MGPLVLTFSRMNAETRKLEPILFTHSTKSETEIVSCKVSEWTLLLLLLLLPERVVEIAALITEIPNSSSHIP